MLLAVRVSPRLVALAVCVGLVALPAVAAAQESSPTPTSQPPQGFASQSTVWVDPADEPSPRTSRAGLAIGVGLTIVGSIQIPIGVAMLGSTQVIECGGGIQRGGFGCGGDLNAGTHRAGAALLASGTIAAVSGLALTIWGASRKPSVRVGLGSVSASYHF